MSPVACKVPINSGATAVQITDKICEKYRIVEHLRSNQTLEGVTALIEAGKPKPLDPEQASFESGTTDKPRSRVNHDQPRMS